jgi:hypothetical protein
VDRELTPLEAQAVLVVVLPVVYMLRVELVRLDKDSLVVDVVAQILVAEAAAEQLVLVDLVV